MLHKSQQRYNCCKECCLMNLDLLSSIPQIRRAR
jgi:hypothetical protein